MKSGSLIEVIRPVDGLSSRNYPSTGKTGIVLSNFKHPSATCELEWFTILIEGQSRHFREDYLKAV